MGLEPHDFYVANLFSHELLTSGFS